MQLKIRLILAPIFLQKELVLRNDCLQLMKFVYPVCAHYKRRFGGVRDLYASRIIVGPAIYVL